MKWKESILMRIGLWCFTKLFKYVDVYVPNGEDGDVVAITFSNDDKYIEKVMDIEE